MEKDAISNVILPIESEQDANTTILHVYHFNRDDSKNYAIHTLRDSLTPIVLPKKKSKKTSKKNAKSDIESTSEAVNEDKPPQSPPSEPTRWKRICLKALRGKVYDNGNHDPRANPEKPPPDCESYFLHLPILWGHCPPYTLRRGGHKRAPVNTLIHPLCLWRKWKLEFGDVLAEDGVIDGRGIVNWRAGTKNGEGGTLKGYQDRKRRWWLESGKKYFFEEKKNGHTWPEAMIKARPDEVVDVKWTSPLIRAREYNFSWRGIDFAWKGTGVIAHQPQKLRRFRLAMTRYNHLKLVVIVPPRKEHVSQRDSDSGGQEIVLARYTSIIAKRKAGRLEIFHDVIDRFLSESAETLFLQGFQKATVESTVETSIVSDEKLSTEIKPDPFQDSIYPSELEREKTRQRLKDLVVASGMCMIVGEYEKRQWIWALFWLMVEGASNGGG